MAPTYELPVWNQTWADSFARSLRVMGNTKMTCNDCFFSGHTTYLTVCFWVLFTFSKKRGPKARFLFVVGGTVMLALGLTSMLSIKFHYTIDLFCGFMFTTLVHFFFAWVPVGKDLLIS